MPKIKYLTPPPKVNHLAALFRAYRKARGMTSQDMARKLGCTPENCRMQMNKPSTEWNVGKLMQYCDVLGIPYEEAFQEAVR